MNQQDIVPYRGYFDVEILYCISNIKVNLLISK